jgi:phosphoenolpyruvate-protein phosphotransferase
MQQEQILKGIAAARGVAVGPMLVYPPQVAADGPASACSPAEEQAALQSAMHQVDQAIAQMQTRLQDAGQADDAAIFAAHRMLLADPGLLERARSLIDRDQFTAAQAITAAGAEQAEQLASLDDAYFRARAGDIRDVTAQVARLLSGGRSLAARLQEAAIIVAEDIGPSDVISVPRELLLGFALAGGGLTAHATILARSLEIPAVIDMGSLLLDQLADGVTVAIDGNLGTLTIDPAPATLQHMQVLARAAASERASQRAQRNLPTVTRDGRPLTLLANAATPDEARLAAEWNAAGIGLLRTELLFLERPDLPDEQEQVALYSAVAAMMPERPIVVRTLDAGGDKALPALQLPQEANPFLGFRGIRIGLQRPELLLAQFRALLRVASAADIRIMLPMITTLAELHRARALLAQARAELQHSGIDIPATVQLGIMIEVPAAALAARQLAGAADFFSIGSNDLTQYTLACERTNSYVADLYRPLEPAVLRLIAMSCEAAQQQGIHCAVCGEMASDPTVTALLIGLGVTELSCSPPALPRIRAAIRATDSVAARKLALQALQAESAQAVEVLLSSA